MSFNFKPGIVLHGKIAWLLLFSVVSLAVASWLIYVSKESIEKTNAHIDQTGETIGIIQQMITSISESYRYLQDDDQKAARQLTAIHRKIEEDLNMLEQLTRENNDQRENIVLLRKYITEKRNFEYNLHPTAVPTLESTAGIIAVSKVTELNNTIKSLLYTMAGEEKNLLTARRDLNKIANQRTAYGLLFLRLTAFFFVVVILINLNRDITLRKENERQLVKAIFEAKEARQIQEQFLANMSHEIRTPMNGIKGMNELLLDTPLSEKQHELAGSIKNCVDNLLVIINDILDFSKIKAGKLSIENIDFSVREVLNNAVSIFEDRLKKKGLLLQLDVDTDIPDRLMGDPYRLNQVLINLLGNAIKFTRQGLIHIQVFMQRQSEDNVFLSFTVTDTGIGISENSLSSIFDSFSQAGQDISRRYGGTGLGLTICKQLLHLQGGDISVTSRVGKGSIFSFYLPYGHSSRPDTEQSSVNLTQDYSNLLTGKHFLVAEDNEINQKLIDYVLKKAGGTVELANNGAEAVRCLQNGRVFDLIIMDLQMPEMDGYAATQFIRKDLQMRTPIIAMTATAMKGEHYLCLESGMDEYMTKPFEFADLYKRIGNLLSST